MRQRDPDVAHTAMAVRRLVRSLRSEDRFPKFLVGRGRYPRRDDRQIGIRRIKGGKCETLFAKDRLEQLCDPNRIVEANVFRRLCELEVVRRGDYALASEQMRVRLPNDEVRKVRFWKLDVEKLTQWANLSGASDRVTRRSSSDRHQEAPGPRRVVEQSSMAGRR